MVVVGVMALTFPWKVFCDSLSCGLRLFPSRLFPQTCITFLLYSYSI